MIDVVKKINKLMQQRNWTVYQLSMKSGLSQQTIHSWYSGKYTPSIEAICALCDAFNMTMADFFSEQNANYTIEVTPQIKALHDNWISLPPEKQKLVQTLVEELAKS